MNNLTPPVNAITLNEWLALSFQLFLGPMRAYMELPIVCEGVTVIKRITFLTVGERADTEIDAVVAMHKRFVMAAGDPIDHALSDAWLALFVRRSFSWDEGSKLLTARLSFWDMERNQFFALKVDGTNELRDPL